MDSERYVDIPVADTTWIKFDRVGKNIENYDYLIKKRGCVIIGFM